MSVRKRHWTNSEGVRLSAWVCDYRDIDGARRQKTFRLKKQADLFQTKIKAQRLDAYLKENGPAEAATSPDRGSTPPCKEKEKNMKTNNIGSASLPAPEVNDVIDLVDMTRHLTEALFMASSDGSLTKDATNALQALIDVIDKNLVEIVDRLEKVSEAAEFQHRALEALTKVIDADAMMAAVREEIARRKQLSGVAA